MPSRKRAASRRIIISYLRGYLVARVTLFYSFTLNSFYGSVIMQ
jgi:hypothetical protein